MTTFEKKDQIELTIRAADIAKGFLALVGGKSVLLARLHLNAAIMKIKELDEFLKEIEKR